MRIRTAVASSALAVLAVLGAAGGAFADPGPGNGQLDSGQGTGCRSHETNIHVLGDVAILNGVLANALKGEGALGSQTSRPGSNVRCDNSAF